ENNRRRMVVETNVRGRDLGSFVSELQQKMKQIEKELPFGYFISYGGQFENQQKGHGKIRAGNPVSKEGKGDGFKNAEAARNR
ncbi:MAG: efflux RND transporter permease subunit, partial [Oligoflexales bacterium]|nr:efflux RND transporter permease subunit [Oligoflexales bacterium]